MNYEKSNNNEHESINDKTTVTLLKDARENVIIGLFKEMDTIGRKDVETALGVSQATAVLILRKMVNKGILSKEGGGKYLRYGLNTIK